MQVVLLLSFLGLATLCAAQTEQPIFIPKDWLKTVTELIPQQYVGRWFQMYGNRFGLSTQGDTVCSTADYKLYNSSVITVRNYGYLDEVDGEVTEIRGMAITTSQTGKFRLRLGDLPFEGSYWVLKLGPVIDGKYDYAVVSSESGLALFVLARDINRFKKYEQGILTYLKEQRFTDWATEPFVQYQGADCRYVPEENEEILY